MKKKISLILAILMVTATVTSVLALEASEPSELQIVVSQFSNMLPSLIDGEVFGVDEENCDNLYVGQAIPSYGVKNGEIVTSFIQYPLIEVVSGQNTVVGLGRVIEYENGEKTIDYGVDCAAQVQAFIDKNGNVPFAIVYTDSGARICSSSVVADNVMMSISTTEDDMQFSTIAPLTKVPIPASTMSANASERAVLGLGYVEQGNAPICWAACIASIINLHYNYDYTAESVAYQAYLWDLNPVTAFDELDEDYDPSYPHHTGLTIGASRDVLNRYGGTNVVTAGYFDYDYLKYYIDNEAPLYLSGNNISAYTHHGCVAYGYYFDGNNTYTMRYMEPNSGFRSANFPSSGAIQFTSPWSTYFLQGFITCIGE